MTDIKTAQAMRDQQGFFKKGERKRIYRSANLLRDQVLIRLLWKSGRRISEVIQIKVKDIDFENNMIYWNILKKKEEKKELLPIDTKTIQLLEYYIQERNLTSEEYLISSGDTSKPLRREYCFKIIRKLGKRAGVEWVGNKKIHPHHFRHSYAVDLSKRAKTPKDIRLIQQTMQHSSLAMTEQYLKFNPEEIREMIEIEDDDD